MNAPLVLPPPHSIDVEQQLLGAVLLNNDAYGAVVNRIKPEDFFEPVHREIFRLSGELIKAGKKATPITLKTYLPAETDIGGMSLGQYLARLAAEATTVINAPDFASHLVELSTARGIMAVADQLRGIQEPGAVEAAFSQLDELRASVTVADGLSGSMADLVERFLDDTKAEDAPVTTTGLTDLDTVIKGGWRGGRLYVLAGRPGMGKTALMVSTVRRAARPREGAPVAGAAIFSLEITGEEILARFASCELSHSYQPVAYGDIVSRDLDDGARARVREAKQKLAALPIRIDETAHLSMAQIAARSRLHAERFAKAGGRLAVIAIDYLGLIKKSDRYRGNGVQELGEVALACKTLAKETGAAVLLLSQLSRGVEGRDDKRPTMADLRQSGEIEEHADMVGLIYRPAYYDQRDPNVKAGTDQDAATRAYARRNDLELILDKNRLGPTTTIHLWADIASSSVDNAKRF